MSEIVNRNSDQPIDNLQQKWSLSPDLMRELSRISLERRNQLDNAAGTAGAWLVMNSVNQGDKEKTPASEMADAVAPITSLATIGGPFEIIPEIVTAELVLTKQNNQPSSTKK
jgi:hypothetical protein